MKTASTHWRRFQHSFADELRRSSAKAAIAIATIVILHLLNQMGLIWHTP